MQSVHENSEPLIVTNKNRDDDVVILSKDDYDALMEAMRILSNRDLMAKIQRGDRQFSKQQGQQHDLIELEDV